MIINDVNDGKIEAFLVRENERVEDLLCKATKMHEVLAKACDITKFEKSQTYSFLRVILVLQKSS